MMAELDATLETDQPFGVPYFIYQGEPFWGQDRIALLEERLAETRAQD
jgi:2-hydroxychromene-2-carboxylate isomerase